MNNKIKLNVRKKKIKAQQNQIIFNDHLEIKLPDLLMHKPMQSIQPMPTILTNYQLNTNFNIKVTNQFVFILLHLRNSTRYNPLNINIPEICIFHDRTPYDLLYSSNGFIRSMKGIEDKRIKLKDVYNNFKKTWRVEIKDNQFIMGCLRNNNYIVSENVHKKRQQKQYLILSDSDLYAVCAKSKIDPFFNNLEYLQNKIYTQSLQPIKISYTAEVQLDLIKLANESIMGLKSQSEISEILSEQNYLSYCNEKISLFLNHEHNIRLNKADFYYSKVKPYHYLLLNVKSIQYVNLTQALKNREKRIKLQQEQRSKIIILTPKKYQQYKHYQTECKDNIQQFQTLMSQKFQSIMKSYNFNTVQSNQQQQIRNQYAFKKLHPNFHMKLDELVRVKNFSKTMKKLYNSRERGYHSRIHKTNVRSTTESF